MYSDIGALSSLLTEAESAARAAAPPPAPAATAVRAPDTRRSTKEREATAPPPDPLEIWSREEIERSEEVYDDRRRPTFEFLFKQHVGAEDVYLGMGGLTPSSVDAHALVVKVHLPGETPSAVDVTVEEREIIISGALHKLQTFLPRPVRHKEGAAAWDARKQTLTLTLPLVNDALL